MVTLTYSHVNIKTICQATGGHCHTAPLSAYIVNHNSKFDNVVKLEGVTRLDSCSHLTYLSEAALQLQHATQLSQFCS